MTELLNLTEGMRMCYVYNIMIIWQHVRKCLTGQYKVDKNAEGIQRGKITGDGPNQ